MLKAILNYAQRRLREKNLKDMGLEMEEMNQYRRALKILLIRIEYKEIPLNQLGICLNIEHLSDLPMSKIIVLMKYMGAGWSHHTGSNINPIPKTDHIWKGEGLDLRKSFIKYQINKINQLLGE